MLRALCTTRIPLSQAELARRAELHPRGLPAILEGLETAGVVAYAGRGRTRQVQLYYQHPLVQPLTQLFQAEANRWHAIQQGLRELMQAHGLLVVSAWIDGPVADGFDRFSDPIAIGILAEAPLGLGEREAIQKRLNGLQALHHVVIAAHYYERADLARFAKPRRTELENAVLLFGAAPMDLSAKFRFGSEEGRLEEVNRRKRTTSALKRPREIANLIASKLTHDPELIARAREFIDRRLALAGDTERLSLLEWKGLLDSLTPGQVASVLRDESPRADMLRQSLPFIGVLTEEERAQAFGRPAPKAVKRSSRPLRP